MSVEERKATVASSSFSLSCFRSWAEPAGLPASVSSRHKFGNKKVSLVLELTPGSFIHSQES